MSIFQNAISPESSASTLALTQDAPVGQRTPSTRLIPAAVVRQTCGGISDMTLWRWLHDPKLEFPRPVIVARNRYWREADVQAWIDRRAAA